MNIEELEKKIDSNFKQINDNAIKIDENLEKIQKNSCALDILSDMKSDSKRLFVILIMVLIMWFATICYLVYILNDVGVSEETTITQDNQSGYNNYIGNDGEITNGKTDN